MARKPVHVEFKGGKPPRQRVWEAIRASRQHFTQVSIAEAVCGLEDVVKSYITSLLRAKFIEVVSEEKVGNFAVRRAYRLVRDNGVEAPRIDKQGRLLTYGLGNEAMWGTLRRMFVQQDFNYRELAAFASTEDHPVSDATARSYVGALADAGYLRCTAEAVRGGRLQRPARYKLIAARVTGPRSPILKSTHVLYDPNVARVVWMEEKGIDDEF